MRAALYSRYSTGNQSPLSIEDQLRLCRQLATKLGAKVVREFTDAEISGFVSDARPGVNALLDFARHGGCGLVIAEHSDRLARDGQMSWAIFNLFRGLGVRYVTVQEGEVTIIRQGVSTLVSELKGEEARHRTRRGLQGVVESGRSGGGLTFGYRKLRRYDAAGEPIRGLLEIDLGEAEIVRRIFREYAAGASPVSIAHALNAEQAPGPRGAAVERFHNCRERHAGRRDHSQRTLHRRADLGPSHFREGQPIKQLLTTSYRRTPAPQPGIVSSSRTSAPPLMLPRPRNAPPATPSVR